MRAIFPAPRDEADKQPRRAAQTPVPAEQAVPDDIPDWLLYTCLFAGALGAGLIALAAAVYQ